MKKVSVVIPTNNRPHLLHKCLQSLISQNFDKNEYEIIVERKFIPPETLNY